MDIQSVLVWIVVAWVSWKIFRKWSQANLLKKVEETGHEVGTIAKNYFLVKCCTRCQETEMELLGVSPNSKSIEYRCTHCQKSSRAIASSPKAAEAGEMYRVFLTLVERFRSKFPKKSLEYQFVFSVPDDPLPFEQTTREPISEDIRSEIWRRDQGRCVSCGSQQNLEFDHIIPVSKGGATTVRNLQLLCSQCNREKSNKI